MRFRLGSICIVLAAICLHFFAVPAAGGPFMLNLDISAGHWKAARLKNLPKGTVLSLQLESNGHILVAVLDSKSYRGQPDTDRPLFVGQMEKRFSFTVTVQEQGDHFILLDNRKGIEERKVRIQVNATRKGNAQANDANKLLQGFERKLHQIFLFDPFPIGIKKCQPAGSFYDQRGAILCMEYVNFLNEAIKDKERTNDFVSFSLFHQVARVLLANWKEPSANSVEKADELATVFMIMLNLEKQAARVAEYVLENPASLEEVSKLSDERHPLTPVRAAKILRWLKDAETIRKWQKTLVPRMQTTLLQRLKKTPTPWSDPHLIEKELAKREKTSI
jgi:hypothetical protein